MSFSLGKTEGFSFVRYVTILTQEPGSCQAKN